MRTLAVVLCLLLPTAGPGAHAQTKPAPTQPKRTQLTRAELLDPESKVVEVNARAFLPIGKAKARERFEGILDFGAVRGQAEFGNPLAKKWKLRRLPLWRTRFTSVDGYLIPFERELIVDQSSDCAWNVVLSPGRIWSEKSDHGWSRAAFPLLLAHKLTNGCLECVATFVYKDGKVSDLHLQVLEQTWPEFPASMTARLRLTWQSRSIPGHEVVRKDFRKELATMLPRGRLSELAEKHRGFDLAAFSRGLRMSHLRQAAVLHRGTLYVQDLRKPAEAFPFPRFQRHGAYSLTKSMGLCLAMLRLAELYGPEIQQAKLVDHIDAGKHRKAWASVRFRDCLDMATGLDWPDRVGDDKPRYDEDSPRFRKWLLAWGRDQKLGLALDQQSMGTGPGRVFRYQTVASFLLATALTDWLQKKRGKPGDLGDFLRDEVFAPIGIQHMPIMRTIETDGRRGQVILGYGLYPSLEDLARVALLLQNEGVWKGHRLLHKASLERALYRGSAQGLPTSVPSPAGEIRYLASFWGLPFRSRDETLIAPYMSGHGGNALLLVPGGPAYLRFLDSSQYQLVPMLDQLLKLR